MNGFSMRTGAGVVFCVLLQSAVFANDLNMGGQLGVMRTLSTATLGKYGITAGGGLKYAADREYAKGPDGSEFITKLPGRTLVRQTGSAGLWSGNMFVACGLNEFIDVSVNLPVYRDVTGWGPAGSGAGDLEIAAKIRYPEVKSRAFFSAAYYLNMILPTGAGDGFFFPRHSWYIQNDVRTGGNALWTTGVVYVNPLLVWTFDLSSRRVPVQFHTNLGVVHGAGTQATALAAALAAEFQASVLLRLFTELTGEARIKYLSDSYTFNPFGKDPVRFTVGFRLRLPRGFSCSAAGDIGITDDDPRYRANWNRGGYQYSTGAVPKWGGQILLSWTGRTRVPDNDRDSVPDSLDRCPGLPEDRDGFEDADGCPEYDNDRDGVADSLDKCKELAEDADGFEDADGCPDYDNDRDGVPDSLDKCLSEPGPVATAGCPSGKASAKRGPLILNSVMFPGGKAVLTPLSCKTLDKVARSLVEWSEVKLEIQGHSDIMEANKKLSQQRAEAVREYLLKQGIAAERLTTASYGKTQPIASNNSAAGRQKNRRVELRRVD